MARNLRAKIPESDTLFIQDINTSATQKFVDEAGKGVEIAGCPREVAEKAETIVTVLPEPSHVMNVYHRMLASELPAASQERLFIDCSTIDPKTSREVANAVHCTKAGRFVDAPMSGGVVGATKGTLTFMLGASNSVVERVKPVLLCMGGRVMHLGAQGAGLSGKLANNYLLALNNLATAEAMNMGIKWGLDPKTLGDMINASTGKCWPSEVNNPVPGVVESSPASRGYSGGFGVSLMRKDLNLAIAAAKESGVRLQLSDKAKELYEAAERDESCKGKDFSVVYRYMGGAE
ncbi:MAG: hypothetical protein M1827_002324 [Pycnora praestabilis]|nr:MAG: hypothetical protein M1827_002324 [Pycnora praestabilis]